jgi:hypothetical protein
LETAPDEDERDQGHDQDHGVDRAGEHEETLWVKVILDAVQVGELAEADLDPVPPAAEGGLIAVVGEFSRHDVTPPWRSCPPPRPWPAHPPAGPWLQVKIEGSSFHSAMFDRRDDADHAAATAVPVLRVPHHPSELEDG